LTYVKSGGGSIENLALTDKGCAQEKRVKGGCQQISEKLLKKSMIFENENLFLNTALIEVRQQPGSQIGGGGQDVQRVEILTKNLITNEFKTFKAKKLISSIPINQYQFINFEPELPWHKRNVFQFCQMGNLIKFIVTYEEPFWRDSGYSGGKSSWTFTKICF
jgi:monoamine oxidase